MLGRHLPNANGLRGAKVGRPVGWQGPPTPSPVALEDRATGLYVLRVGALYTHRRIFDAWRTSSEERMAFPRNGSGVAFWSMLLFVELVTVCLHLPSLRDAHIEGDEIVFTFLAERLTQDPFAYHLRGVLEGNAAERFLADTRTSGRNTPARGVPVERGSPESVEPKRVALLDSASETVRTFVYDSSIYGKPMFFHPPVYPYTLAGFRRILGRVGGPLLSILAHGFTILLVGLLGRRWGGPPGPARINGRFR